MKKITFLLIIAIALPFYGFSQDKEEEKSIVVELNYIKVKKGSEGKFVSAVEAHNEEYHPEGPYQSFLYYIRTGEEAGWYVWGMGAFSFTELDGAPKTGEHSKDWQKRMSSLVEDYGRIEMWRYSTKFSHVELDSSALEVVWFIGFDEVGFEKYKAFMDFLKNVNEVNVDNNRNFQVFRNSFPQDNGRDMAFIFPMTKWADIDNDKFNMKEAFDTKFGEGSWEQAMELWMEVTESMKEEVWQRIL